MADLDDFFAKKDKKKKSKSGFHKANTDILSKKLEESERKSEQKAIDDSKAAQLATSEAAKTLQAGNDAAAAGTDKDGAGGAGGAPGAAVSGLRADGGAYFGTSSTSGSSEIVLATTDAARKANMMIGLGDDGTVKRSKSSGRVRCGAHEMSHCTCLAVTFLPFFAFPCFLLPMAFVPGEIWDGLLYVVIFTYVRSRHEYIIISLSI